MRDIVNGVGAIPRRFAALPASVRGALWMGLAAILLTLMAVSVRKLSADMHTFEIVFFRAALGLPLMAPWLIRTRLVGLRTRKIGFFVLRGVVAMAAANCFFAALALVPLADATAIMFSRPLFATILAILFLNEVVSGRRWTAMAVGFLGVLILVRPGFADVNTGLLLALAGALFAAAAASTVRYLARTESPDTITIYFTIVGSALMVGPAIYVWQTPTWEQVWWILLMGFLGTQGQRSMARAISTADISIVLPVDFTRLVFAALFGWFLFAEIPDIWTWVGGAVIFASSIYIARREAMHKKQGGNA